MQPVSKLILPYDPDYTGHREAAQRHLETLDWLRRRELLLLSHLTSPDIAPKLDGELGEDPAKFRRH